MSKNKDNRQFWQDAKFAEKPDSPSLPVDKIVSVIMPENEQSFKTMMFSAYITGHADHLRKINNEKP